MQKQACFMMTRIELPSDRAARRLGFSCARRGPRTALSKKLMMDDHVLYFTVDEIVIRPPKHDENIHQEGPKLLIFSNF